MNEKFLAALLENNWKEIAADRQYSKGNWSIRRDTSSWWMIIHDSTGFRGMDFPEP